MRRLAGGILLLAAMATTSCVHEFPDPEPAAAQLTVHLDFSTELPLHEEITYDTRISSTSAADYDVRYIVNVYPAVESTGTRTVSYSRTAVAQFTATGTDATTLNRDIAGSLDAGQYKLLVWADYVDKGSSSKFYNADDFAAITLQGDYEGNTDFRDAFRGELEATVEAGTATELTVGMERPLAKILFKTTDLQEFITRMTQLIAEREESRSGASDSDTRAFSLSDYRIVFSYTGYMPNCFNMFTNKPGDAITGVTFDGAITRTSDTEAQLGFDYVFVNGTESSIQIAVGVYDTDGTLLSSSSTITVPIVRSKLTIVSGKFLTAKASGGAVIDPSFDGEYNIEIK